MAQHAPRFLQLVDAIRINIRECTGSLQENRSC